MIQKNPVKMSLREAFETYYDKSDLRKSTQESFQNVISRWERFMGDIDIHEITNKTISDLRAKLIATDYSPATIRSTWTHLRSILRKLSSPDMERNAGALDIIQLRPWMKPVRMELRPPRRVSLVELSRVYDSLSLSQSPRNIGYPAQDYWRSLIVFIYFTGLRRSDFSTVKWSQLDLADGLMEFTACKTMKSAYMPLHPSVVKHLKMIPDSGELVFPFCISRAFYKPLKNACEEAGVKPFTFHDLRRTAASEIARVAGKQIAEVFLQHSQNDVTSMYYLNQYDEVRDAINEMRVPDSFLKGPDAREKKIIREDCERQDNCGRQQRIRDEVIWAGSPRIDEFIIDDNAIVWRNFRWAASHQTIIVFRKLLASTYSNPVSLKDLFEATHQTNPRRIERILGTIRKKLRLWWEMSSDWNPVPSIRTSENVSWTFYCPAQLG